MRTSMRHGFNRSLRGGALLKSVAVVAGALALLTGGLTPSGAIAQERVFECSGDKVCRDATTKLPIRVLMRPLSTVYTEASDASAPRFSNLPPFLPWFVFEDQGTDYTDPDNPTGWFQVGRTRNNPEGFVRAADAFLWNTSLVVTYAPLEIIEGERRSPVVMFNNLENAQAIMDAADPNAEIQGIVAAVDAGDTATLEGRGVVSIEPKRFLDFDAKPYILPVVNFEQLPLLDSEARYLQVAAAVPQTADGEARGATTVTDEEYVASATSGATSQGLDVASLTVEIKFVIDMTGSMGPYQNATISSVTRLAEALGADPDLAGAVKYGLVGFTDVASECGDCPFVVAKDFTPGGTVDSSEFVNILSSVRVNGGGDYEETMFEGVTEALNGSWSQNSLKFIVVIGDASSNPFGGPKNNTASADEIRTLADAQNVVVMSLHAKDERARPDWPIAEAQFRAIANASSQSDTLYYSIEVNPSNADAKFQPAVLDLIDVFAKGIGAVRGGDVSAAETSAPAAPAPSGPVEVEDLAEEAFASALITYVGSAAERPRDLTGWVVDIDPADLATPTLDVRILLEKRELDDLVRTLEAILEAFRLAKTIESDDFFSELQSTMTGAALDRDIDYSDVKSIAGSGIVPAWLEALPYKSQIMGLTAESYADLSNDDRAKIEESLDIKLEIYRELLGNPDIWQALSETASELEYVYPVPLRDLP